MSAQALTEYDEVHAITFDYGQRHKLEIEVAQSLSKELGVKAHKVMDVTPRNGWLISSEFVTISLYHMSYKRMDCRTLLFLVVAISFLTLAGIYAYQIGAETVITGVCETDFSGYPDHVFCKSDEFCACARHG
ncbi:7-cyano-7-deazaguanine synthase [Vibrio splendidus]|uniref:7-cyano-7-deazaguanine synthase n=1 Tax=Vibrio splendidus TaxID=29497 RepID=UPI0039A65B54